MRLVLRHKVATTKRENKERERRLRRYQLGVDKVYTVEQSARKAADRATIDLGFVVRVEQLEEAF